MRTMVLVALLLLPALAHADGPLDVDEVMAIADQLAEYDTPVDLKTAILFYERALEADSGNTSAMEKVGRAKQRLQELARPARARAHAALAARDYLEAERYLCDAIAIDPFDWTQLSALYSVREELRRDAVELHDAILRRRSFNPNSLGVPPEAESLTNDPDDPRRIAAPAHERHSG